MRSRRSSFLLNSPLWLLGFIVPMCLAAPVTNKLEAEIEGRELSRSLVELKPEQMLTNHGVLKIRDAQKKEKVIPLSFQIAVTPTNWSAIYKTSANKGGGEIELVITHENTGPNRYSLKEGESPSKVLSGTDIMSSFAGSDFLIADLGLEFLHWPAQKVLRHEISRGQACKVLESINPNPAAGGYSRVVSWIDNDTGGIVQARAYDARGRWLKAFEPKKLQKVNGQHQLREMLIFNREAGTRTTLEFELDKE